MDPLIAGLIPNFGDIAGGFLSAREAGLNRDFNAQEAEKQRQWQTEMSNTAYQRAKQDMIKAGINPILGLAGSGGASVGTGASASSSSMANFKTDGLNIAQTIANLKNTNTNTAVAQKELLKKDAETAKTIMETQKTKTERENISVDTNLKMIQAHQAGAGRDKLEQEILNLKAQAIILEKQGKYYDADRIHKLIQEYGKVATGALSAFGIGSIMKQLTSLGKKKWIIEDI